MTFMYLELSYVEREDRDRILSDGVHVKVKNDGACNWLGSENSRRSSTPFAVYKIAAFDGLGCISDDDLWSELESRKPLYGTHESRFVSEASTEALMAELSRRLK